MSASLISRFVDSLFDSLSQGRLINFLKPQGQTLHWDLEHRQFPKAFGQVLDADSPPSAFYHVYQMHKHAGPRAPRLEEDDDEAL
jgi:hypothetical protein